MSSDMVGMRVAVLYGGISGEREISLVSGSNVAKVLTEQGLDVQLIDTGQTGFVAALQQFAPSVAFVALHGKGGEDGTMQGLLELLGIPYTGSGVLASSLAMDKERSKLFYRAQGLNVPISFVMSPAEAADQGALQQRAMTEVGLPCVVKPVAEGSSLGVYIVRDVEELASAINAAFSVSSELMVEAFVQGREVTVSVLGNDEPYALPVIEIIPHAEFYDYEAKYAAGGSTHICPAELPDDTTRLCQQQAVQAHLALDCSGMSRTDFIIDASGTPWVLETNIIPGMTGTSLLPDAAHASGLTDGQLYCQLIEYALQRGSRLQSGAAANSIDFVKSAGTNVITAAASAANTSIPTSPVVAD